MPGPATRLRRVLALGLILACSPLAAAAAQSAPASLVSPDGAATDTLRPGQYRWHPEAAPGGRLRSSSACRCSAPTSIAPGC